jgi:hypothetical protein
MPVPCPICPGSAQPTVLSPRLPRHARASATPGITRYPGITPGAMVTSSRNDVLGGPQGR